MFIRLFSPIGWCSLQVEEVGHNIFDSIVGVIHHNPLGDSNERHHQMAFNFSECHTVFTARFVPGTVNWCKSGQSTITLGGLCACKTVINCTQVGYLILLLCNPGNKVVIIQWRIMIFVKSLRTRGCFNLSSITTKWLSSIHVIKISVQSSLAFCYDFPGEVPPTTDWSGELVAPCLGLLLLRYTSESGEGLHASFHLKKGR